MARAMKKFVVYEIWTRSRVVEARDAEDAYTRGEPNESRVGLRLSNWHATEVERPTRQLVLKGKATRRNK